jgi:hypothetical protein
MMHSKVRLSQCRLNDDARETGVVIFGTTDTSSGYVFTTDVLPNSH